MSMPREIVFRCKCGGVFLPVLTTTRKEIYERYTYVISYFQVWKCSECGKEVGK